MKTKEEWQAGCADLLKQLRIKKGYSKAKMANVLYLDEKTWNRYENGITAPTVPEFIYIFNQLNEDALPAVLRFLYPDAYTGIESVDDLRKAAAHYFLNVATDRAVREWAFLSYGAHGSNIEPQMQEFTMLNHLPMVYRVAIAEMIYTFWQLAETRNELIHTEHIMPDVKEFMAGLEKGHKAVKNGINSYTTVSD